MPPLDLESSRSSTISNVLLIVLTRQVLNRDVFQLELRSPHQVTGLEEVQTQQAMGSGESPLVVGTILDSASLL